MIKVSLIIPVYNNETDLEACLDRIFQQTLSPELELICVDYGSTDNSLYILRRYENKYDNLIVVNQLNSGAGNAKNSGICKARGEFVAFMDPVDYYSESNTLEILYDLAKKQNVMICGGTLGIDDGVCIRKGWAGNWSEYNFDKDLLISYRDYQFDYGYQCFIYNREMLLDKNIFFPCYRYFENPPFFIQAMTSANVFYATEDITYCCRKGSRGINWTEKLTVDLLKGITDDLIFSTENGLQNLHCLTAWRLFYEYREAISLNMGSQSVITQLLKAGQEMNMEWLGTKELLSGGVKAMIISMLSEVRQP